VRKLNAAAVSPGPEGSEGEAEQSQEVGG
jgi:hypothetical protein